jgi:type II secretory pathway component GspD/PulD (secretin)
MANTRWVWVVLAVVFVVLAAAPARAEEDAVRVTTEGETRELEDFLQHVDEVLDLPLIWDPRSRAIAGKQIANVDIQGTRAEVFSAFRALLAFYELVVIPVGPAHYQIYVVMDARQTAAIMKLKPVYIELNDANLEEYENQDGLFVTTVFTMQHMTELRDARNALNRIVTGQNIGNVTEVPSSHSFLVTDFAPNVVAIYRLLRVMDEAAAIGASAREAHIHQAIQLEHADAVDLAGVLAAQFGANEPGVARPQPQGQQPLVSTAPRLLIHADERTNQLLVTGYQVDLDRVVRAVATLDVPVKRADTWIHVVRLDNIDAAGAARALTNLIMRSPAMWSSGERGAQPPTIEAHSETNSLIVNATSGMFEQILRVVQELDAPQEEGD